MRFKQRTVDLLRYCAMPMTDERWQRFDELCQQYSRNAVVGKLYDLCDKDYIEYGTSIRGAWLTPKGKAALAECEGG